MILGPVKPRCLVSLDVVSGFSATVLKRLSSIAVFLSSLFRGHLGLQILRVTLKPAHTFFTHLWHPFLQLLQMSQRPYTGASQEQ